MYRWNPFTAALIPAFALGCSQVRASGNTDHPVIDITAGDYHFIGPDTVPGGLVTFRARNSGTELHHVQIVRFEGTRTLSDLVSTFEGHGFPSWVTQLGGVGAVAPGDSAAVTLILTSGRYAFICFIPSPDGVLHLDRGMMWAFAVTDSGASVTPSRSDLVMVLDDYRFELSGSLKRGTQIIEVTNAASQPHEVVLVRLEPGRGALEFVEWFFSGAPGPALGRWMGGTVGLGRGERNWITVTLERGTYALLCFLPDHIDGREHIAHGMVREITID